MDWDHIIYQVDGHELCTVRMLTTPHAGEELLFKEAVGGAHRWRVTQVVYIITDSEIDDGRVGYKVAVFVEPTR